MMNYADMETVWEQYQNWEKAIGVSAPAQVSEKYNTALAQLRERQEFEDKIAADEASTGKLFLIQISTISNRLQFPPSLEGVLGV